MKKKKIIEWYDGAEYEIIPTYDNFIGFINVDIRKVEYPHRKFFRTILVKCKVFNPDNYDSIEEGCQYCFKNYIEEYEHFREKQKKLEKFFENA
jgi:hypothetical protein